jgi:molybdopterin biosynthesis enzyme
MPDNNAPQRITKLTPIEGVFHKIDALAVTVRPRACEIGAAASFVLAENVTALSSMPKTPIALNDGYAVRADDITDAGPYAPVSIGAEWIEAGDPIRGGSDAVLPPDAASGSGKNIDVNSSVSEGEGVWPAGADAEGGATLGRAGELLHAKDVAVLEALGIKNVSVRVPKILIVHAKKTDVLDPAVSMIARMIEANGGETKTGSKSLDAAFADEGVDAIIVIGGSGAGKTDRSVATLAEKGRAELYGVGIQPGETAALGVIDKRPVLIVPGRLDAALSIFSLLGLRLVAKLAGRTRYISQMPVKLSRKVTSPVGIASFVPLERISKSEAAPLASGTIPLSLLARADGWLLVPAESEGYPAGTEVEMRLFP